MSMKKYSIQLDDGIVEIEVNNDPERIFKFKSKDPAAFDDHLEFIAWFDTDFTKFAEKMKDVDLSKVTFNDDGTYEVEGYERGYFKKFSKLVEEKVDKAYGPGSSKAAFGGTSPITPIENGYLLIDFMSKVAPIMKENFEASGFNAERANKINQHKAKAFAQQKARNQHNKHYNNRGKK